MKKRETRNQRTARKMVRVRKRLVQGVLFWQVLYPPEIRFTPTDWCLNRQEARRKAAQIQEKIVSLLNAAQRVAR